MTLCLPLTLDEECQKRRRSAPKSSRKFGFHGSRIQLPAGEQRPIADYLDRETARIDGLIAEKERMLALLEEKRAALVSRVVTRGLDPKAPMKPSGLDGWARFRRIGGWSQSSTWRSLARFHPIGRERGLLGRRRLSLDEQLRR